MITRPAIILLLAAFAAAPATWAADPQRGRLLYETFCYHCHISAIHYRVPARADSWGALLGQVALWQGEMGLGWSRDEVTDVAAWLDRIYYQLADAPGRERNGGDRAAGGRRKRSGLKHGPAEVMPLRPVDANGLDGRQGLFVLDALGHGDDAEIRRQFLDALDDGAYPGFRSDTPYQFPLELDECHRQLGEIAQGRVTGAEIVDRQADAHIQEGFENVLGLAHVLHELPLGDLDDQRLDLADPPLAQGA